MQMPCVVSQSIEIVISLCRTDIPPVILVFGHESTVRHSLGFPTFTEVAACQAPFLETGFTGALTCAEMV
jgi:hypothetical protein